MFHRRLLLLLGLTVIVTLGLAAQQIRLAVVEGPQRRAVAERRLKLVSYLPTYRGRVLDRHGRVLAVDRPSYDVAIDYEAITGAWALQQAGRRARSVHRADWAKMSPKEREAAVTGVLPEYEDQLERIRSAIMELGGIDRLELDRRLDAIKREVQSTAAVVWDRQLRAELKLAGDAEGTYFHPRPIREQRQAHVILPRVTNQVAFAFRRLAEQLPQAAELIEVQDSHLRAYPWRSAEVTLDRSTLPGPLRSAEPITIRVEGVADHLLGSMRDDTWESDLRRRPFKEPESERIDLGGYRLGDAVGARGLERVYESHLRGQRGRNQKRLDTGRVERSASLPGRDLHLTVDIALQARVQAILSPELGLTRVQQWQAGWGSDGRPKKTGLPPGTPLNSAAVVLEVESGEILALVSMPTIAMGRRRPPACRDQAEPWVNRPVEAIYPPGSIIKPLVLAAAVSEGVQGLDEEIECTGHYFPDRRDRARCWIYRAPRFLTHGPLDAEGALAHSCNIYFYALGEQMGMSRLASWYRRFGLGRPLDVGLLHLAQTAEGAESWRGESAGMVPGDAEVARLRASGELKFASVIMGSGQGPLAVTPIQIANAYATLSRRGAVRQVTLVREPRPSAPPAPSEPYLDGKLVERILAGLAASVTEQYGTSHHIRYRSGTIDPIINAPGVTVWGKSGTAQAPPDRLDLDCDGEKETVVAGVSHAWFMGLIGPTGEGPAYAVAVIVEYGGSGGRTAGPVANQIIHALRDEGYLTKEQR